MADEKNTTNDDLAIMIKKGFDGVDERFDSVEKKLDNHAVMLVNHGEILKDHTERLKKLEKNQKVILIRLEGIVYREEFEELAKRLKRVEAKLGIK